MNPRPALLLFVAILAFMPTQLRADDFYAKDPQTGKWVKCDEGAKGATQLTDAQIKAAGLDHGGMDMSGAPATDKKGNNTQTGAGDVGKNIGEQKKGPAGGPPPPVVNNEHNHVMPGGETMPASGVGTAAGVKAALLVAEIRTAATQAAGGNRKLAQVISRTADAVVANITTKYPEPNEVPANNVGSFSEMLRIQLAENKAIYEVENERGLTPQQRDAKIKAIQAASNTEMTAKVKGMEVMTPFHEAFNPAWTEWKAQQPDKDKWGSGLPNPAHIGGMLNRNPRSPSNWTLDAQSKLEAGDKAGGRASLDKAISLGGTADAFGSRGAMKLEAKDYDGAYQDAKKALELNPGDKNLLGLLKSAEGRTTPGFVESLAAGKSGASESGGGAGASENRGAGVFASGGFDPGRVHEIPGMTSASTISSNQKLDEARRAMSMGDIQAAIALAQRALELNPRNAAAHGFLSALYARSGDYRRSVASASAGLALAPRDASLLNNKAFAENRLKQYRDALESSNNAIESDARNPYSYANRAYAFGGLGDRDGMLSDINRAASMDPRFQKAAADAAALQLPSNADILFLFPGEESAASAAAAAAPARSKSFGLVVGAGILGGLLLALGLLSTVLAPLKDTVVSAFTKATRRGPTLHALDEVATQEPASVAGNVGGLIRGQYEILRQIGAGGMGMVYEGTDRSLGRRVAIKKMREELRLNPRERERFVIEAKTVASLHHANIVDIYSIAEEGEDVYLVFEYVDGKTIHELVQAQGRLSPTDSLRVTHAMGEALTYAHAHGVIHRDMKPSNVMLTKAGQIKVMDFGIARMAKDAMTRYSMTNTVVGTPPYMAPEQEQGVVRKESDVYSLAICSYEMLTGKLPFIGMGAGMLMNKINMSYIPPSRNIAGLPESIDEVFLKAFQADPDQRYRTPLEFATALQAAFGGVRDRT